MSATQIHHMTLTDQNFQHEVLESSQPVLVDFWASWCGPCRVMGPVVDELSEAFAGQVVVGSLNVDDFPNLAARYEIRSIPALLFFKNGKAVDQAVGVVPRQVLAEKLRALI
jgi:thioredoxin 1